MYLAETEDPPAEGRHGLHRPEPVRLRRFLDSGPDGAAVGLFELLDEAVRVKVRNRGATDAETPWAIVACLSRLRTRDLGISKNTVASIVKWNREMAGEQIA